MNNLPQIPSMYFCKNARQILTVKSMLHPLQNESSRDGCNLLQWISHRRDHDFNIKLTTSSYDINGECKKISTCTPPHNYIVIIGGTRGSRHKLESCCITKIGETKTIFCGFFIIAEIIWYNHDWLKQITIQYRTHLIISSINQWRHYPDATIRNNRQL